MKNSRRPYILIREFKRGDEIPRRELIKQYVMSFAFDAFLSCLFREVSRPPKSSKRKIDWRMFLSSPMLSKWTDFHPVDGLSGGCDVYILRFAIAHLFVCNSVCDCLPLRFRVLHILQQGHGAGQRKCATTRCQPMTQSPFDFILAQDPITNCWVAEAFEPFHLAYSLNAQNDYDILHEEQIMIDDLEANRMRRSLVGTIMVDTHRSLPSAGWISHFAISTKHKFDKIAEPLVNRVLKYSIDRQMSSAETATTECQCDFRELLLKMDFTMKQVYHRQVLGCSSLRIMKSQMGVDLLNWTASKNKWRNRFFESPKETVFYAVVCNDSIQSNPHWRSQYRTIQPTLCVALRMILSHLFCIR